MKRLHHKEIKNIFVYPTKSKAAKASAKFIASLVLKKPRATVIYATGNTQIPVYSELGNLVKKKKADFSSTRALHLDEYYPCTPDKDFSFVGYLRKYVFGPLKIKRENIFEIDGCADNAHKEAKRYEGLVNRFPSSLTILGIGPGGHIGFNEPGSSFKSKTRLITLSKETLKRDRVERGQSSPDRALTLGIGTILESEKIVLNAFGERHGKYLDRALSGKINISCPASAIRLVGDGVTLFLDEEAARQISSLE